MIKEDNLTNLYQLVLQQNEITTKDLNSCGFNSTDITNLIKQDIVERVERGTYKFLAVDSLFQFGKVLALQGNREQAEVIYKRCLEIDPQHRKSISQLFLYEIFSNNYEEAFKYLMMMEQNTTSYTIKDINIFLFLLNHLIDLPEKYKNRAKHFVQSDILPKEGDNRYKEMYNQQRITYSILNKNFGYASSIIKNYLNDFTPCYRDLIVNHLTFAAAQHEKLFKQEMLELAKNKEYSKLQQLLETKNKKCNLSKIELYILKVANTILNLKEVSINYLTNSKNVFEAIDACDFNAALMLSQQYSETNKVDSDNDTLSILLIDLASKIKELNKSKKEHKVVKEQVDNPITVVDILNSLLQNNFSKAYVDAKKYLVSINKGIYDFLIIDLIKLSLVEKDIAFSKPMIALTYLSKDNYQFNVSEYVQEFYFALSKNQYAQARIYLDIIAQVNKLGHPAISVENLVTVLNAAEGVIESKQEESKIAIQPQITIETKPEKRFIPQDNTTFKQNNNDQEFVEAKHQMLLDGRGIVLLKPMDNIRRKNIHRLVERYPDMKSFSIGEGKDRRIVLRYRPFIEGFIPIKELKQQGDEAYKQRDYQTCIESYLKILQFGNPRSPVYAKLGLAYMKMKNIEEATNYLTVATQLSKNEKYQMDFTELILKINSQLDPENIKPKIKMKEEDFGSNLTDTHGIDDLEAITETIINTGKTVESVGTALELSSEQINMIKLIYARSYYSQGDYKQGDLFIRSVEKSNEKSENIKNLLEEIRRNKKFYINRRDEQANRLSLVIKP